VIGHSHTMGDLLIQNCNTAIKANNLEAYVQVIPCNWLIAFSFADAEKKQSGNFRTLFLQEMIKRGVLFQGAFYPCFSHTEEDIQYFVEAFNQSLAIYAQALTKGVEQFLIGEPTKAVFRKFV
jgi:glutamate-1-semialdehyde 2,1-aminomutase